MGSRKEEKKRAKGKSPELSARDLGISLNPPCLFLSFSIFDLERPNVYSRDSRVSDPFLSILNLFLLSFASRPFFWWVGDADPKMPPLAGCTNLRQYK